MNRICHLRRILSGFLLVTILSGVLPRYAQSGYPTRVDPYVNDFASLLTSDHTASLRSLFSELKSDNGVEIVLVTIDSIHDYATGDTSIESFATNLFNTWGLGNAQKNDGVLVLVAWKDRAVRIEVGTGYGNSLNADMQAIINEQMIPAFRREDYSQGIYDGARAVSRKLTARSDQSAAIEIPPVHVATAAPLRVETEETSNSTHSGTDNTPLIVVGLVGGAAASAFGAGRYARYHKRRCPSCQTYMIRLDEVSDDVYLDSGQKVEELLQSVDYDIWKCPTCSFHTLQGYNQWLSGFGQCPSCNYRTLKTDSQTVKQPTYTSTGEERISRDCRHCKYHTAERVTLPMLTRTEDTASTYSSSHSSSNHTSSGGHSSGGGASGKW